MESSFYNAKQIFEKFGIPRAVLEQLVVEERVSVKVIKTDVACLKLYDAADIERVIGSAHG